MLKRLLICAAMVLAQPARALDGETLMHDPSTVIFDAGHYYTYGTGNGLPTLTSDDGWTWRRGGSLMSAAAGRQTRTRRARARRQQHLGAGRHPHRRQVLRLLLRAGHATEVRDRTARRPHARSAITRLQVGRRRTRGLVRRHRRQQRHRPRRAARSGRTAVDDLRFVLRLHPARRARSENRPAPSIRIASPRTSPSIPKRPSSSIATAGTTCSSRTAPAVRARTPRTTSAWGVRAR